MSPAPDGRGPARRASKIARITSRDRVLRRGGTEHRVQKRVREGELEGHRPIAILEDPRERALLGLREERVPLLFRQHEIPYELAQRAKQRFEVPACIEPARIAIADVEPPQIDRVGEGRDLRAHMIELGAVRIDEGDLEIGKAGRERERGASARRDQERALRMRPSQHRFFHERVLPHHCELDRIVSHGSSSIAATAIPSIGRSFRISSSLHGRSRGSSLVGAACAEGRARSRQTAVSSRKPDRHGRDPYLLPFSNLMGSATAYRKPGIDSRSLSDRGWSRWGKSEKYAL